MKTKALLFSFALFSINSFAQTTWQKLFSKKSTDSIRYVQSVPGQGYVAAGYTANFNANDTNAYVVMLNFDGDTIWTKEFGSIRKDLLYKIRSTVDGGYIVCGYSSSYGAGSDDAYYAKLNNIGEMQWFKTYGTSGKDRAQDIIETSDGGFAMVGYTSSPGANYFDAFFVKTNAQGDTVFTKVYGGISYDDANTFKQTSDGGYILAGQTYSYGAGNGDIWVIKINSVGDSLWAKVHGTPLTDNADDIQLTSDGGFILSGGSESGGFGAMDGLVMKLDASGDAVWTKYYGGSLPDDFHSIKATADGNYVVSGTSSSWGSPEPNMWMMKINPLGDTLWNKVYGGVNHDHGYAAEQTPDGGYIMGGHTGSFGFNYEDGYIVKTDSNGDIFEGLYYESPFQMVSPANNACGNANSSIRVIVRNFGNDTINNLTVNLTISGFINTTLTATRPGLFYPTDADTLTFPTTINTTAGGSLTFSFITVDTNDVVPANNTLDSTISVIPFSTAPSAINNSRCGSGSVQLGATGGLPLTWFTLPTGGFPVGSGTSFNTPNIATTTTYYVQSGSTCPSGRTAVIATINNVPAVPAVTNGSRCGTGSVTLTASGTSTIEWWSDASGGTLLGTGTSFATPSISATTTYYAAVNNGTCSSARIATIATINTLPANPTTQGANRCGNGTVTLSASGSGTIEWWSASTGGSLLGTGSTFTTPSLAVTTNYYASNSDGTCSSDRTVATATINNIPAAPSAANASRCGTGSVTLSATGSATIEWWDAASGGSILATGTSFNTPSLSSTTQYFISSNNGTCSSNRVAISVTINAVPAVPATTGAQRCGSGSVTLTASGAVTLEWWSAAIGGSLLANGTSFITPSLSNTTQYYVASNSGVCSSARIAATATINSIPNAPNTTAGFRCGTGTVSLSASGAATLEWWSAATGGVLLTTGTSYTTPSISTTTTYHVASNNGLCSSARTPVVASIGSVPAAPSTIGASRCGSGTLNLSASGTGLLEWYGAASGGTLLFTGAAYTTPVISTTTTYYVQSNNSGCISTNRTSVVATINSIPTAPSATSASRCGSGTVALTASGSGTLEWFSVANGGSALGTGSSFNTPTIAITTVYYVQSNIGNCVSTRTPVTATINTISSPPTTTDTSRCGPGTAILVASATDPISWFTNSSGGTAIGSGSTFNYFVNNTSTYYASAGTLCPSARVPLLVTIDGAVPPTTTGDSSCGAAVLTLTAASADPIEWYDAISGGNLIATGTSLVTPLLNSTVTYYAQAINTCPSSRVATLAEIRIVEITNLTSDTTCGVGTVSLLASSNYPITWYDAIGGNIVGTGNTLNVNINNTTTFYAQAGDAFCSSSIEPTQGIVANIPAAPSTVGASGCGASSLILSGTGSGQVQWYATALADSVLAVGNQFTTPLLNTTTNYYVGIFDGTCLSTLSMVSATINAIPADPVANNFENCGPGNILISAQAVDSITWFDTPSPSGVVGSGSTFTTPFLNTTTTFYAQTSNGNCNSNYVPVMVIIYAAPIVNLGGDTLVSATTPVVLNAGVGFNSYSWTTGDSTNAINVFSDGSYCVTITDSNDCTASDCIYVRLTTSISNIETNYFDLYPNPIIDFVTIRSNSVLNTKIQLFNSIGMLVLDNVILENFLKLDLSALARGTYYLRLSNQASVQTQRIILQ